MENMIDTGTALDELAAVMSTKNHPLSADNFYSRISFAKYYEKNKKSILQWNWECKIGLKDDSFAVRTNSFGIKGANSILNHRFGNADGLRIYQILNSYNEFLKYKLHSVTTIMNSNKKLKDPLD